MAKMFRENEDKIIRKAAAILEERAKYEKREFLESPEAVKRLFINRSTLLENEVFAVAFLDNRHRLIEIVDMFNGTIDAAAIYPREVVKEALKHNAAAVVLSHNHPSGVAEPSRADIDITSKLKKALALVDVRVLDHIIVGSNYAVSLAERGEM